MVLFVRFSWKLNNDAAMQSKILVIWRAIQLSEVLSRENGVEFRCRLPVSDKKSGTVQRDANCRQDEAAALLVWNRCFRIVSVLHSYDFVFKWWELAPFLYENCIEHRSFSIWGSTVGHDLLCLVRYFVWEVDVFCSERPTDWGN